MKIENEHYSENTLIPATQSLYDYLENNEQLKGERSWLGILLMILSIPLTLFINAILMLTKITLIKEGEIGLSMNAGTPVFVKPGWHTFVSPFHSPTGTANIDDDVISCGNVTIVKVAKGKLGVIENNGDFKLLEPGRHVLKKPQKFVEYKSTTAPYIKAGSIHRIRVEEGENAVYYNELGQAQVLEAGTHYLNDPKIRFKEFLSKREIVRDVEEQSVSTSDGGRLRLIAQVRYRISDVKKLVNNFQKNNYKKGANAGMGENEFVEDNDGSYEDALFETVESTLTGTFLHHRIDEIAPKMPKSGDKDPSYSAPPAYNPDFSKTLSEEFMSELKQTAHDSWGIDLISITFKKLEPEYADDLQALFTERAKENITTVTNQQNADSKRMTKLIETQGQRQQINELAAAEAEKIAITARAEADAFQLLAQTYKAEFGDEAAKQLMLLKQQAKILTKANCTFLGSVPNNITLLSGLGSNPAPFLPAKQ